MRGAASSASADQLRRSRNAEVRTQDTVATGGARLSQGVARSLDEIELFPRRFSMRHGRRCRDGRGEDGGRRILRRRHLEGLDAFAHVAGDVERAGAIR